MLDHTHYTNVHPPPDQNAGTLWRKAADAIEDRLNQSGDPLSADVDTLGFQPWTLDTNTLRSITNRYPELLSITREAANRPHCQLIVDPSNTFTPDHIMHIGRLMIADGIVKGRDGHHTQAVESFANVGTLASDVQTIPTLIDHLISLGLTNMTLDAFQNTFRNVTIPPGQSMDELLTRDLFAELQDAIVGDLPLTIFIILDDPSFDTFGQWPLSIWHRYDLATLIERTRALHTAVGNSPGTRPHTAHTKELERIVDDIPGWSLISQIALPGIQHAYPSTAESQTRLTLAHTAIGLREHKRTHGSYPSEDRFDLPPDPYAGGHIRYRQHQDGFILWSGLPKRDGSYITWHWDCDEPPDDLGDETSASLSP